MPYLRPYSSQVLSMLRILSGLLLVTHGTRNFATGGIVALKIGRQQCHNI